MTTTINADATTVNADATTVNTITQHHIEILTGDCYQLTLKSAPNLVVDFLSTQWQSGMTAAAAAALLNRHGYVAPKCVSDRLTGRVLGTQSTLRNWGEMAW